MSCPNFKTNQMITASQARSLAEVKTDWFDDFIVKLNADITEKSGTGLRQMNTSSIPDPIMIEKVKVFLSESPRLFAVENPPKTNYLVISW